MLPGHGTATDALWAKIPLITFPVRKMASRAAASFAAASGSGLAGGGGGGGRATIVRNLKDYVQVNRCPRLSLLASLASSQTNSRFTCWVRVHTNHAAQKRGISFRDDSEVASRQVAIQLGRQESSRHLDYLRADLEATRFTSPMFDTRRWVREFNKACRMLWEAAAPGMASGGNVVLTDLVPPT